MKPVRDSEFEQRLKDLSDFTGKEIAVLIGKSRYYTHEQLARVFSCEKEDIDELVMNIDHFRDILWLRVEIRKWLQQSG